MERGAEVEVVRQQLMGLVALLLSLAALADRACFIPHRARMRSLHFLRMAETAFVAFIADMTGMPDVPSDHGGNSVEDAARLAARLRALAIVMAGTIVRLFAAGASAARGYRASAAKPEAGRAGVARSILQGDLPPFDTS